MNAVNAVQLLFLLWTFTDVCQADDDDISVICENVTGTVRKEVTLTCNVSLKCSESNCIDLYKFQYPEGDSAICRKEFPPDPCEQRNRFTCSFTPTTAKTEQFRFFVQTLCGRETAEFTVSITEPIKLEPVIGDPETLLTTGEETRLMKGNDTESNKGDSNPVIISVASCFIIILIIITMTIICKRKSNYQPRWIPVFLGRRHDENNSDCPVNVV